MRWHRRPLFHILPAAVALQLQGQSGVVAFSMCKARVTKILRSDPDAVRCVLSMQGDDNQLNDAPEKKKSSHIVSIKSSIAGMVNDIDGADIQIDFGPHACLVAITGESGSGKSLLVSKTIDLVTGGKAVPSLIPASGEEDSAQSSSFVELAVNLHEPHLSAVSKTLQRFGIDPSILNKEDNVGKLHLRRTFSTADSGRLKSVCRINDKHISLKTLRQIAAPLFTRVDVGVASSALGIPASRLTILDMGVPEVLKRECIESREKYKGARGHTERIKRDLQSRVLPSSLQRSSENEGLDEEQLELMKHWVDELDSFEARMSRFQESLTSRCNEFLPEKSNASNGIMSTVQKLRKATWEGEQNAESSMFTHLVDFRGATKAVEAQLVSTHAAYETLASLTAPNSALVALENTRKLLYDICSEESGPLFEAVERAHEQLNNAEVALSDCARSIDGKSDSVMSTLENMDLPSISIEEVDNIIADWSSLARKHGITPYSLPKCHMSLRDELDGNVEALRLLPEAEEDERLALGDYSNACKELSDARHKVAVELSESVSNILPSLGLEGTVLQIKLDLRHGGFEEPYHGVESLGVDTADFLLLHQKNVNGGAENGSSEQISTERGGKIEQVGSSGEKSRVLLAFESALPGSIGSICNSFSSGPDRDALYQEGLETAPISIIYDEIDAHVGGRAAVTMAKLLADQATGERASQIIAITHSPSVAATADCHIVVERGLTSRSNSLPIRAYHVDGADRRKEIARMASGDLATGEAQDFADALIRDALLQKETSPPQ